jgi:hypothetical protein
MAIEFNPGNVGKINNLIQSHPQLNVTDNSKADYASNFKKADADGNGAITRDEFKRFAKDALPATTDLSVFGGAETQLADFDVALGEWFDAIDQAGEVAPAAAVSEKAAALPPLDAGKTWTKLGAEKIARGEDLNFGHKQVDGQLWKMQDGSPVWADTGSQISREQLAAMPDYQVKKFYQMMGLGYDPKVDFPDASARQKLADAVRRPDPGSALDGASQSQQAILKDLDQLHAALTRREDQLKGQLEGADPATARQIEAQLAQLAGTKAPIETMRAELKEYQVPVSLSSEGEARVAGTMKQIHDSVKRLAGVSASERGPLMASFVDAMNQLRQPDRDMQKDPLAQNQFNTLVDASRVLGALGDRMDNLVRQRATGSGANHAQIDAQLAQLKNVYVGFSQIAAPLFEYRADPALSDAARQEKAALIDGVHTTLKQMAGMDATQFQGALDQVLKQLQGL